MVWAIAIGERGNSCEHCGREEKMIECDELTDQQGMSVFTLFHYATFRWLDGKLPARRGARWLSILSWRQTSTWPRHYVSEN